MTALYLTGHDMLVLVLKAGGWLAIGALIGTFHYITLRWNTQMFANGASVLATLAIQLTRFAVVAGVLAIITRHYGALPLLVAALGVLASRPVVLHFGVQS